jgi:hypothetical protein
VPGVAVAWLVVWLATPLVAAADPDGAAIYREHCRRCHGEHGAGAPSVPAPLVGDLSINQLAAYVDAAMPEDDPTLVTGARAREVAAWMHETFYSPVARDRHRPPRVEVSRLTVRQHRATLADLVGSFRGRGPAVDGRRGLRAEYFHRRNFDRQDLVFERIDPEIDFQFGVEGPDPERFETNRFAIRWSGALVPPETGTYEFVLRTEHAVRCWLNDTRHERPFIDASVKSGDEVEYRASLFLLGGRAYPLRVEFSKANQGVDDRRHEPLTNASVRLEWRPPHGVLGTVPEHCLIPADAAAVFVPRTPFPPDDRSIGYERGTTLSQEWFAAATEAARETAAHVLEHVEHLAGVARDAPARRDTLREFAATFAARAFRRPLSAGVREAVVDGPFAADVDPDTALRRSLLLVLTSPRFLYRETAAVAGTADDFDVAERLSFGLWDSIPDQPLWDAADRGRLATPQQVRREAERMVGDRRTRAKIRDFLFAWLRVDLVPDLSKEADAYAAFTPEVAEDLRRSLEIFLDDVVWEQRDFRRLFVDDALPLNGRLAAVYGVDMPAQAGFRRVRLDDGRRAGVLTHPYLMSVLSYTGSTSPIHRGVFLARHVLGNVLRPPQEAIAPLAPEQHPGLSTRERVELQTSATACQSCHTMINPLGFALEQFDAIGRFRDAEVREGVEKPIDATGWYAPRRGGDTSGPLHFEGGRELGAVVAESLDAQEAFVQGLFHALVKQPVRAWGDDVPERLRRDFANSGYDIPRLLVDIMVTAAEPPPAPQRPAATSDTSPPATTEETTR